MKALVTGATGFIGSKLCRELKKKGFAVRALVLPGENTDHISGCVSEIRTGDITARGSLEGLCEANDNDLGWQTIVSYEDAMRAIHDWVMKYYLK